jgi:hypothetical protein
VIYPYRGVVLAAPRSNSSRQEVPTPMGPEGFAATPTARRGALGTVTNRSAPSWEGT